jgi:ABC-type transport system involved in multi-copper enzyme maturation permease subunit
VTGNVGAVFLFEWKRAMTWPRMAWWAVLAAFPVFIIGLIRFTVHTSPPREFWAGFLFALFPMLVSMLGTFLWTAPAISAELERRSWVYLAVRPNGGAAVLLGKYLASVTWVIPPALVGLTIATPLAGTDDGWSLWWALARLVCLSCPAYAAVYLLLGTLMPRRAMVLAVAYTLIFELVISFVPAVINELTVQYRLRALLLAWCDLPALEVRPTGAFSLVGDEPASRHILVLMLLTPALLAASLAILRYKEFTSSAESDI